MPGGESHRRHGTDHHVADDAAEGGGDKSQENDAERIEPPLDGTGAAAQAKAKQPTKSTRVRNMMGLPVFRTRMPTPDHMSFWLPSLSRRRVGRKMVTTAPVRCVDRNVPA